MVRTIRREAGEGVAESATQLVRTGVARLWWLGGASFVVRTPQVALWIDPFFGPPARPEFHRQRQPLLSPEQIGTVDGVLITHEHNDHCHLPTLTAIAERVDAIPVLAPSVSAKKIAERLPELPITTVAPGYEGRAADVRIQVFRGNDRMADEAIMFLLHTPGGKLFFAGDSLYAPGFFIDLQREGIDVACFSVGDLLFGEKAYMTPAEFGLAAEEIGTKTAIPVHWDLWEEAKVEPEEVDDWGTKTLKLLQPGEGVELS